MRIRSEWFLNTHHSLSTPPIHSSTPLPGIGGSTAANIGSYNFFYSSDIDDLGLMSPTAGDIAVDRFSHSDYIDNVNVVTLNRNALSASALMLNNYNKSSSSSHHHHHKHKLKKHRQFRVSSCSITSSSRSSIASEHDNDRCGDALLDVQLPQTQSKYRRHHHHHKRTRKPNHNRASDNLTLTNEDQVIHSWSLGENLNTRRRHHHHRKVSQAQESEVSHQHDDSTLLAQSLDETAQLSPAHTQANQQQPQRRSNLSVMVFTVLDLLF